MNLATEVSRLADKLEYLSRIYALEPEQIDIALHHRQTARQLRQMIKDIEMPTPELIGCNECGTLNHYTESKCSQCGAPIRGFF